MTTSFLKAEETVTFAQQFPNVHTAEVIAGEFGKNVNDVMDQSVLSCTEFDLEQKGLADVTGIDVFTNLQYLNLSSNQITSILESIGKLSDLQILNLLDNQLTNVPESIGNLTGLIGIDLSNNHLSVLPLSLIKLQSINEYLNLSNQTISLLPKDFITQSFTLTSSITAMGEVVPHLLAEQVIV
ncbi:hypothetical protein AZF37_06195 [endosymbiont 'TC1' of Trimyema compressum]|uniref:leucine-rich repeat domain-containing protein n=1 Tax=endosymbiont 'TC1' of Trimyema compressum TaxID=243899 RepID=UPI0007F1036E|nr:leucine-rich repeat domain-containing protein [endosymbiont 'TC1' of Trimyema compressum]AMP20816.1 hypothetical protein AZF37_06195 [endosymbiont 'TC1' of Trimyema compressum]